jgi:CHASE2 domain-containing sensor protein
VTRLKFIIGQWLAQTTRKLRNNFYIYLAAFLTVFVLIDAGIFHVGENMRQKAFDFMVRYRLFTPQPDADIVIVDINEASLAAMAGEYGRYPWPRQIFGEFLENLEAQKPKAVVFDILFSDADIANPDSDAYFNETIASTDNTFFPFIRLSEEQDRLSAVKPSMLPGVEEAVKGRGDDKATLAVILPHFAAAVRSGRMGFNNIYPDKDGIVREYCLYRDDYGWRVPSLALQVGKTLGYAIPETDSVLLNWRGKPFTYRYVSFSDVFLDMTRKAKKRPPDEFTRKIVIIGSTAPSLFDLKATPMARMFPGVEILATAVDNIKHGDYLHVWRGALSYVLFALILIWLTCAAFYKKMDRDKLNRIFSSSQVILLGVSYATINATNTYFDLTGPVIWAIAYFSVAKIYALANDLALQRWLAFGVKGGEGAARALILPILVDSKEPLGDALMKRLKRKIEQSCRTPNTVDVIKGSQSGIWGLFADMVVVCWTYSGAKEEYARQAQEDAEQLIEKMPLVLIDTGLPGDTKFRYTRQRGLLSRAFLWTASGAVFLPRRSSSSKIWMDKR